MRTPFHERVLELLGGLELHGRRNRIIDKAQTRQRRAEVQEVANDLRQKQAAVLRKVGGLESHQATLHVRIGDVLFRFISFKTLLTSAKGILHRSPCPISVPFAGFQPSLIGRFWVSPDGAHMMTSIPPKYAVSQVVGLIKGKSASHLARSCYTGNKDRGRNRVSALAYSGWCSRRKLARIRQAPP